MAVEDTSMIGFVRRRWNALTGRLLKSKYATKADIEELHKEIMRLRQSQDSVALHMALRQWQEYERSIGGRGY